jgi:hypothetical protein
MAIKDKEDKDINLNRRGAEALSFIFSFAFDETNLQNFFSAPPRLCGKK